MKLLLPHDNHMNDPHESLLERYFWNEVERGIAPAATPLFTGIHNGEALTHAIRREFDMPDADAAIELARREVEL